MLDRVPVSSTVDPLNYMFSVETLWSNMIDISSPVHRWAAAL